MRILSNQRQVIDDIRIITFQSYKDERGSFAEIWTCELEECINEKLVQLNESTLTPQSVRGLHSQYHPKMGKLVRCIEGEVYDYAIDIRKESATLGKALIIKLCHSNEWLWIPDGFAHAVYNVSNQTGKIQYFCSSKYNEPCNIAIYPFSDGIDYSLCDGNYLKDFEKLKNNPIISEKDKNAPHFMSWSANCEIKPY